MKFPDWCDAPEELLAMEGHCGLLAAWAVLRHFGKRISVPKLVRACGYTKRHGVFTVGLAAGLKEHGLRVSFHSDPDTGCPTKTNHRRRSRNKAFQQNRI